MGDVKQRDLGETKDKWKKIFLYTVVFIVSYFILITSISPKKYNLNEGDTANVNIKAPREIIDEEATKEKERELVESISKEYSLKGEVKLQATKSVTNFFTTLINLKSSDVAEGEKVEQLKKIEGFNLTDSEYKTMINATTEKTIEMQWVLQGILEEVYSKNISEDDTPNKTTLEEARSIADNRLLESGLEEKLASILKDMAYSQIKPNYYYDSTKTEQAIIEKLKTMQKVMIKKDQIIVYEGEIITQRQIQILTDLGLVGEGIEKSYLPIYLSLAIFVFLVLLLQFLYIKKEKSHLLADSKKIILIALLNILTLILARVLNMTSPYLIPIASTTILMTILLDYKLSFVLNSLNAMLVAVIVGFNPQIIILIIVSIIVSIISIKKVNDRNDVLYATVFLVIGSAIVTFTSGILLSNNINLIFKDMLLAILGALFSGILAIGLLPFLEIAFKIITNTKLLELSNPNSVLLKRILLEAPGTYHHSLMVANLAEVAAEEVGANPIITRIGAYYHDIGKLKRPIFFGENQMGRENPHNNIDPSLSTHIILSHAKDGLELAKEYNLPKVIQDIIIQHHGTTLVKFFYYTVKNKAENPDDIKEEDFMYTGPIPTSKEAAIVMLADSVEAAVRSINEPTKEKIEEMVNNIIKDKLYSNQLNECELTFKDIETIKKCFLRMLNGLYHQRIEYPKEKK